MPKKDDVSRPVTLYVEKVETQPTVEYLNETRVSVIDIDIPIPQAMQILEYIRERNYQGMSGAIRIRLSGRLVHL